MLLKVRPGAEAEPWVPHPALSSWASHLPTLRLFAHVLIGVKDPPPGRTHERGGLPAMLALRATLIRTKQEVPKL